MRAIEIRQEEERKVYLLRLTSALLDPLLGLIPSLVESKETSLSATLDKLIGLCDKLGGEDPAGKLSVGGDGIGLGIPRNLGNLGGGVYKVGRGLCGLVNRRSTFKPVGEEKLCVVLADG